MSQQPIRVGIVGVAGRGGSFRAGLQANGADISAVCDVRTEALTQAAKLYEGAELYEDYQQMLDRARLDAVVIGTPMQFHVPQSIAALQRGLHVLCEVPAGVSIDECRDLVATANAGKAMYMMAENYCYAKPIVVVRHLVKQGLFGELFYAEGEYIHELKELNELTPWRRTWQTGIPGITYGTHSLGPILQWMEGDRVARVACETSGSHYRDPRGRPYAQDSAVMLAKTVRGALVKIRVDMVSDRPHLMNAHQLQGTDGVFESSRGGPGDRDRIWLRSLSKEIRWHDLAELMTIDSLAEKSVPEMWRNPPEAALKAGHGGSDYFGVEDFMKAITGQAPCPIGIHEAMDMTLPGLVSQESARQGGAWLDVHDSRRWTPDVKWPQLQMAWPAERVKNPPQVRLPHGYVLRQLRLPEDRSAYLALLHKAGFTQWNDSQLAKTLQIALPGGYFVVEHTASGALVATAIAQHHGTDQHPFGAELGWVAADPEHKGKGLGFAVSAAATARMLAGGYTDVYLRTDDTRLPALKVYLDMGYQPLMFGEGMTKRWSAVRKALGMVE